MLFDLISDHYDHYKWTKFDLQDFCKHFRNWQPKTNRYNEVNKRKFYLYAE